MRMGLMSRCAITVALVLTGWHTYAAADLNAQYRLNVPPLPVFEALKQFSAQTNLQIVYYSEVAEGINSPGAVGELTAGDALGKLLGGTGLTFQFLNDRTVAIVQAGTPARKVGDAAPPALENPAFVRMAQAVGASSNSAQTEATSSESRQEQATSAQRPRIDPEDLGEIVVTGTNIRGIHPESSPLEIYTAEDIARTGATTTEQFLAKLPQNLGTRTENTPIAATSNREAVNGVDLRGLGVGTTLTLLNGRRLGMASNGQTADISLIPMSAIERVEVLTDGASAIYGSDAVGGVVNFVLRKDFEGADTRLGYGNVTDGSREQLNATQTFGWRWGTGHGLVSYDYYDASPLEVSDRSYAVSAGPGYLTPDDQRHSALVTISQDLGERLTINGDLLYSRRETDILGTNQTAVNPANHFSFELQGETEQYFANLGVGYRLRDSLNASFLATFSDVDVDTQQQTQRFTTGAAPSITTLDTNHRALDLTAMLDGVLFAFPAGDMRYSIGGGYLGEKYDSATVFGSLQPSARDLGRRTTYAFVELHVPLLAELQGVPLAHRLELSLAARYTNYVDTSEPRLGRDFGDETSPKVGLLWAPLPSLNIRATYGESFRAPSVSQLDPSSARNTLNGVAVVAGVASTALFLSAFPSPELDPETANSYTVGFDFRPAGLPGLQLGATYFSIDYEDRIGQANTLAGTANPAAAPEGVYRATSAEQIEQFLRSTVNVFNNTAINLADPQAASLALFALPNFWIQDSRFRNLALSRVDGVDLGASSEISTDWGDLNVGAQVTKVFDYQQQDSASSPILSIVDTLGRPVDLRGRAHVGFSRGGFDSTLSVNYVDDYVNPLASGSVEVDSWTTVDLNIVYGFEKSMGLLEGVRLGLSAQNVFDEDPPLVTANTVAGLSNPAGFDPANASPLGRFLAISLTKRW